MKVGDTVYLKAVGNNARYDKGVRIVEHKVVKVGRKYFEVSSQDDGRFPIKFHLSNNREVSNFGANWKLYFSEQEILDEHEYNKLHSGISSAFGSWSRRKFTLQQLRDITKIISEVQITDELLKDEEQ